MFKPMLACSESAHNFFDQLHFPLMASPKIDGIRATVRNGVVYARSNEPIRNINVQRKFGYLEHFDGELGVGDPWRHDLCRATASVTNSKDKPVDELMFHAFDHVHFLTDPFDGRLRRLTEQKAFHGGPQVRLVEQAMIRSLDDLLAYEDAQLEKGYEGLILRAADAPYKCGRSTANEQYLLKLKRFVDGEFKIVGFYEEMKNNNAKTTSALGRSKRSSHKENKEGKNTLGGLILEFFPGVTFRCGSGFNDAEADKLWKLAQAGKLEGQYATIKYFAKGMKDLPRHPTYKLIRPENDK